MNYSESNIEQKIKQMSSSRQKLMGKIRVNAICILLILFAVILLALGLSVTAAVREMLAELPDVNTLNLMPGGTATILYDANGEKSQELTDAEVERSYAEINDIPEDVRNAFIAEEDARFYEHQGIDIQSIIKDIFYSLTGNQNDDEKKSTITQQLVENQVFGVLSTTSLTGKIRYEIQKKYLAMRLEEVLGKNGILEYYLNTINLGDDLLGVQDASQYYFNKDVAELSASEGAVLAGLVDDPEQNNPITNTGNNARERKRILKKMLDGQMIDEETYEDALGDDVYNRIQQVHENSYRVEPKSDSCYVDAVASHAIKALREQLGYTQTQAYNAVYRGGLQIYTCQDESLQTVCDNVMENDAYYPRAVRYYLSYRLKVRDTEGNDTEYDEKSIVSFFKGRKKNISLYFKKRETAEKYIRIFKKSIVSSETEIVREKIQLIKQPQASFVLIEHSTGQVKAITGGRGEESFSALQNHATNLTRQPGEVLTPLGVYLPALDTAGMTLGTVQDDSPAYQPSGKTGLKESVPGGDTEEQNYGGLTTLREAIVNSVNSLNLQTLETVTPQTGFDYLTNLGFTTLIDKMETQSGKVYTDIQLSIAQGQLTTGVTNLELTAAYASVANGGMYTEPVFYTRILDKDGNTLIDNIPETKQVMKTSTAWLLTSALQEADREAGEQYAFNNISVAKASKSGGSEGETDLWFEGYTPYYTAGIWMGYDNGQKKVTGNYCQRMWHDIMERVHILQKKIDGTFADADDIVSCDICSKCGKLAVKGLCDEAVGGDCIQKEYFVSGTEPDESCDCHVRYTICKQSQKLAQDDCEETETRVYLIKEEQGKTADTPNVLPKKLINQYCPLHGRKVTVKAGGKYIEIE